MDRNIIFIFMSRNWSFIAVFSFFVLSIFLSLISDYHYDRSNYQISSFLSMVLLVIMSNNRSNREHTRERLASIRESLLSDKKRQERAQELYLSSDYYKKRANFNNLSSIFVLLVLVGFVAFAGSFLNHDTIQFAGVDDLKQEISKTRDAGDKSNSMGILQQEYTDALRQQIQAEASVANPLYRMATSFIIRISVVGVGVYLVIMLNRAYKYNNSLSSLYKSRLISTLRGDDNMEEFAKYTALISAESVEYNVDIEHPTDRMVAAFDKVAAMFERDKVRSVTEHGTTAVTRRAKEAPYVDQTKASMPE